VKPVFVDTSGFYALLDRTDPSHADCLERFRKAEAESWALITTNYVIHETWALVQARLGWEAVAAWRDRMVPLCEIVWVDEQLHSLGEARCRQARERRLSLTDCVSMEVMRRRAIGELIRSSPETSPPAPAVEAGRAEKFRIEGCGRQPAVSQDEHFLREGFSLA
jgi:predicted nucleic acid-binding protein